MLRRKSRGHNGGGGARGDLDAAYRRIVDSAIDHAIFTTDPNGIIDSWSPGAKIIMGWTPDEAIGQSFNMTFTPEDNAAGEPEKERITARTEGVAPNVRWHIRKDGSRVFIDGTCRAMFDTDGRLIGFVKVGQDVTERRMMEEQLRESEAGLRSMTETLEARVSERTAALSDTNRALLNEIREREMAEGARTELIRMLVTAEENERGRISRELHDHMGQQLTGLLLGLRVLEREAASAETRARLQELAELAAGIARDLHAVALVLRPPALDNLGLERALQSHLEEWSQRSGIGADFHVEGVSVGALTSEMETTIYRIVQEGLTNVLKHARASHVSLVLERVDGTVAAILEDNGVGFDPDHAHDAHDAHLGLRGMRERVALLGGELEIESAPGSGTTLFARIPVPDAAREPADVEA